MGRYPLDFSSVREKLDRAAKHIGCLDEEIAAFRKQNPVSTYAEFETDHAFLVKVRVPAPPNFQWGVVLGDAIHNLRCALDHAVWELVQRNVRAGFKVAPTEDQARRIQYPIFDKRAKFNNAAVMGFLTTRQIAFLRRHQPYRRRNWPEATPLSQLAWLSNTDKHRIVHGAHTALDTWDNFRFRVKANLSAGRMTSSEALVAAGDRLIDGTPIARLTFEMPPGARVFTGQDPHVEVEGEFASEIRFGEGRPLPISQLSGLHEFVFYFLRTLEIRLG